jgi:hypothetical protein
VRKIARGAQTISGSAFQRSGGWTVKGGAAPRRAVDENLAWVGVDETLVHRQADAGAVRSSVLLTPRASDANVRRAALSRR